MEFSDFYYLHESKVWPYFGEKREERRKIGLLKETEIFGLALSPIVWKVKVFNIFLEKAIKYFWFLHNCYVQGNLASFKDGIVPV